MGFLATKITLMIFIVLTMTLIAERLGILNHIYTNYIFLAGLLIQIIMLITLFSIIIMRKRMLKRYIKIIRHKIEDKYIKGNTDILPEYIEATNPMKPSIFKIFLEVRDFKDPPDFGICKMGRGSSKITDINKHLLNVNAGIIKGSFIFDADIIVRPNEKINFKFKDDTNVKTFFVGELYIP